MVRTGAKWNGRGGSKGKKNNSSMAHIIERGRAARPGVTPEESKFRVRAGKLDNNRDIVVDARQYELASVDAGQIHYDWPENPTRRLGDLRVGTIHPSFLSYFVLSVSCLENRMFPLFLPSPRSWRHFPVFFQNLCFSCHVQMYDSSQINLYKVEAELIFSFTGI